VELLLLLPAPTPSELPLLGPPPPGPSSSPEPPEAPHGSGVGLVIGQSSTGGKETLASKVSFPVELRRAKVLYEAYCLGPVCRTVRTGNDTGPHPWP
jgi:hypothetical protein